jgi:hypothetical protein
MIESARALCGGLLLIVLWFSILSASIPSPAAANGDTAATKAHTHHRDGVKTLPKKDEPSNLLQYFWQKPKDIVQQGVDWALHSAMPKINTFVKTAVNGFIESLKAFTFLGLLGLFALLVISAYIGTSFANGAFVRKLYKIVERLHPANKPVIIVLDEDQMKVINPPPTQPVLESATDKTGQSAKKEPVVIDIKPRATRRSSLTSKLRKVRRKSRADKEAA